MTAFLKNNILKASKSIKMKKQRKKEWRVVAWHNDFPDGSRAHNFYGADGPIFSRVLSNISSGAELKWKFHGGFINSERTNLLRRLKEADVLIAGTPSNMDFQDDNMHWDIAEQSLLDVLQAIKKENKKLKIFFLREPYHLTEEFQKIGEFVNDIHEAAIYNYFSRR